MHNNGSLSGRRPGEFEMSKRISICLRERRVTKTRSARRDVLGGIRRQRLMQSAKVNYDADGLPVNKTKKSLILSLCRSNAF